MFRIQVAVKVTIGDIGWPGIKEFWTSCYMKDLPLFVFRFVIVLFFF